MNQPSGHREEHAENIQTRWWTREPEGVQAGGQKGARTQLPPEERALRGGPGVGWGRAPSPATRGPGDPAVLLGKGPQPRRLDPDAGPRQRGAKPLTAWGGGLPQHSPQTAPAPPASSRRPPAHRSLLATSPEGRQPLRHPARSAAPQTVFSLPPGRPGDGHLDGTVLTRRSVWAGEDGAGLRSPGGPRRHGGPRGMGCAAGALGTAQPPGPSLAQQTRGHTASWAQPPPRAGGLRSRLTSGPHGPQGPRPTAERGHARPGPRVVGIRGGQRGPRREPSHTQQAP